MRLSQVLAQEIDPKNRKSISVLSGPSQAEDVVTHDITLVTVASDNAHAAKEIQGLFMNNYFRVYTSDDVIGVEIGAALKTSSPLVPAHCMDWDIKTMPRQP